MGLLSGTVYRREEGWESEILFILRLDVRLSDIRREAVAAVEPCTIREALNAKQNHAQAKNRA